MRFSEDELVEKALRALAAVGERAEKGGLERTAEIRFLLAFLSNHLPERRHLDELWRELSRADVGNEAQDYGRRQTMRNLVGFITNSIEQRRG